MEGIAELQAALAGARPDRLFLAGVLLCGVIVSAVVLIAPAFLPVAEPSAADHREDASRERDPT